MVENYFSFNKKSSLFLITVVGLFLNTYLSFGQINFSQSTLNFEVGNVDNGVTSLMYGPDGRLYVAELTGKIKILTIERNGPTDYIVTQIEELDGIQNIIDHNDDGSVYESIDRETIGLTVGGTAANPLIYVSSSDIRIGAGSKGNGDQGLDTNSGIITRFSWNGNTWDVVDLVRGLPRSEENHATNGMELTTINGVEYLIVAQGGHTNGGAPSTNFAYTCEYALSGAILSVNLDMLNSMPILEDDGRSYIYDLPTLDDPTRANVNGITDPDNPNYDGVDVNDPFGGNDGLNMAIVDPTGPVQILSAGYRNAYDLVITQSGGLYVTDNGANGGWGGFPANEGGGNATNEYISTEPGSTSSSGGEQINNVDHLQLVTTDLQNYNFNSFYGGHPNPIRANPSGAGLYTDDGINAIWRTMVYDPDESSPNSTMDPNLGLPANWPPVQITNAVEGDWRGPGINNPDGPNDDPIVTWGTNTNGIAEYKASNFGGVMQGNLLAGTNGGVIRRVELDNGGTTGNLTPSFLSGIGGNALGIAANGDDEIFPGTIWAGTITGTIVVFEPQDLVNCIEPTDPAYEPLADYDDDGYTNQDEVDNGTDPCNGGSQPNDFDKSQGEPLTSDLNDADDDFDGIPDALDPFQLGNPAQTGSDAFSLPISNALFNDQQGLGGIFGLGMTGLMNNGNTEANWLDWIDDRDNGPNPNDVLGGAPGIVTSHMTSGTALGTSNTQEKAYQYGIQTNINTGIFTVIGGMNGFTGTLRLYGNTAANGGELGFFIGDGTQSNYIKFVVTVDGFILLQEIDDVPQNPITVPLAISDRPTDNLFFYFVVNPSNGNINFQYSVDEDVRISLGSIQAEGAILNALQNSNSDLAVGFIGTSGVDGVELEGSWDFLNVLDENPIVVENILNIERLLNSPDEVLSLDDYFEDDNGDSNLTYSVSSTNPLIGAVINSNELILSYPSTPETSIVTIRATDAEFNFIEQSFMVEVTGNPIILYRVNAGGPNLASVDEDMDWEGDTIDSNSSYLSEPGSNTIFASTITALTAQVNSYSLPAQIFESERYDAQVGSPNMTYSFPVQAPGNYEVRLYMGNSFAGTSGPEQRIFDVLLEGVRYPELNAIDLSGTYGHQTGTVITYIIPVNDGVLDVNFVHGAVNNPLVNGIEIIDVSDDQTPIYLNEVGDRISNVGQQLNGSFGVQAVGGDGNLTFSAVGLPPGIFIEPTNGQIGGTIDESALLDSPYNVTVTVDDSDIATNDQMTTSFTWTIFEAFSFRINAGGLSVSSSDIGSPWEQNSTDGAQNGGNYSVNTGTNVASGLDYNLKHVSIPAYIDQPTFDELFATERYDISAAPEMEYSLPLENGDYQVNIYLGNSFNGTNELGDRVFDILIENILVEDDLDLIAKFGHQVAGMVSFSSSVLDGELNIGFAHVVQNPVINAIEVFKVDSSNPIFSLSAIQDQSNDVLNSVNFSTSVAGGTDGENTSFYMSGQPEGISINEVTGEISGTIAIEAASGGSQGNGVHSVMVTAIKPLSAPSTQVFNWTVGVDNLWTDLDENENYTGRHENSFVQAGDKFYLMGGRENAKTIDVYNYSMNTWTQLVDSPPFEFNHFQATEYKGLIWVIGSFKTNNYPNEQPAEYIWMFDPARELWIQGPEIPAQRRRGSAGLVVYNDKFYIVAGNTIGHTSAGNVSWFDEYDPSTGQWTTLTDAPIERDHFSAVVIDDKLYAAGGRQSSFPTNTFKPVISQVDVYDFATGTWSTLPSEQNIPTPRAGAVTVNFKDKLYVVGGEVENEPVYGINTTAALKITESYDPVTQSWSRLPDLNHERHGTQGIVSGDGIITVAGSNVKGGGQQKNMEYYGEYNPIGSPSVGSGITAIEQVFVEVGSDATFTIDVGAGNVSEYIQSMEITGSANFTITSGRLEHTLVDASSSIEITVALDSEGENETAILYIHYGAQETLSVVLTNDLNVDGLINPGTQYNLEGDLVNLPVINTNRQSSDVYSATGLPPTLTIDEDTGVISGTILSATEGEAVYNEEDGLLIIEAENLLINPNYSIENNESGFTGNGYLFNNVDSFNTPGNGLISAKIQINTPGVYRFQWRNRIGIIASNGPTTEHNDAWLRFPDASSFYAQRPGSIIFPSGSGLTPNPAGAGSDGWFKVYTNTIDWNWTTNTSDNDPHQIYVQFDSPGIYTMELSSRSDGHIVDRAALHLVSENYSLGQLNSAPESTLVSEGIEGAEAGSPYNVEVTVSDVDDMNISESISFNWVIGEEPIIPVTSVTINPETVSLEIGKNLQLIVDVLPSGADDTSVSWASTDENIVSVDENGLLIANGLGTATITVTTNDGGLTDSSTVTVTEVQDDCNWIDLSNSNLNKVESQSVKIGDKLYVLAGFVENLKITGTTEIYDTNLDEWSLGTPMPLPVTHMGVAVVNEEIWIIGGFVGDNPGIATDQVQIYNTVSNTWRSGTALPAPRASGASVLNGSKIHYFGGLLPDRLTDVGNHYVLDLNDLNSGWSELAPLPDPRNHLSAANINGLIYAIGGQFGHDNLVIDQKLVDVYNPDNDQWSNIADLPFERSHFEPGTTVYNGKIIIAGGRQGNIFFNNITEYDPTVNQWSELCPLPENLLAPNIKVFGNRLIVSNGGIDGTSNPTNKTRWIALEPVVNQAPVAHIVSSPSSDNSPLTVDFDGSYSTDDNNDISIYSWDFGDGSIGEGSTITHTFDSVGSYNVILSITDGEGLTDSANMIIEVTESPVPVTGVTVDPGFGTLTVGATLQLTSEVQPSGATDTTVSWSSSDDAIATVDMDGLVTATGMGTATITVTTTEGGFIAEALIEVSEIANVAPTAVAIANILSGQAPLEIEFDSGDSSDDQGIISYLWDFGTGDTSDLPNPVYIFEFPGTFEVYLTVTDEGGLEDTTMTVVEVSDNVESEVSINEIIIAPNPAVINTEVSINLEIPSKLLGLYVYDINGKLVRKINFVSTDNSNGEYELFVGDLSNGIYSVYTYIEGLSKPLVAKMIVNNK